MPFYEYQCKACGAEVEALQKITDAPLKKCPECGKNQLAKLISAPVFRLKGGGWYETDFKTDKDNKRNLVGDKDEAKSEPKPEVKADAKAADAKPEAKAESKPESKSEPKPSAKSKPRPVAKPVKKKSAGKAKTKARR